MTEDLNYDLFWGPKWSGNLASETDIQHTSKSSSNWHVDQDWCETSGISFEKMTKDRIFDLFWSPKCPPKIGHLRTIFSIPLKVLAMSMWSNADVKPAKRFEKITEDRNLDLLWGPKLLQNWSHASKSRYNERVKQYWCETSGNFLRKWPKTGILDLFLDPKIGPLGPILHPSPKVIPMSI